MRAEPGRAPQLEGALRDRNTLTRRKLETNGQDQQKIVQYLSEAHATERGARHRAAVADCDDPGRKLPRRPRIAPARNARPRDSGAAPPGRAPTRQQPDTGRGWAHPERRRSGARPGKDASGPRPRHGGEEKVLKNAKDACASEALEIATYTAIECLASSVGDSVTQALATSIRADEQKMLDRILREIPKLTEAVVRSEVPSYDISKTGAADTARSASESVKGAARDATSSAKRTARKASKVPGVAQAEGQIKGALASEGDLAIAGYAKLTAAEVVEKLAHLSQIDLAKIDSYERKNENRTTILSRITSLRGDEPWAGYDELGVDEIRTALDEGDENRIKRVRSYERSHKNRSGVIDAVERELVKA